MITLAVSVTLLILGYLVYGRVAERFFGTDPDRATPAFTKNDGIDYIPMKGWRVFMIQFLNIAGLGPIFGAILGAMYGPVVYIWIVLGCIFMGATHDYFGGMLSVRNGGASLPELVGTYLGRPMRMFLRAFTLLLLVFVGVAFVSGPAKLLYTMSGFSLTFWLGLIFFYYILATLLPIDKIIGLLYPFFGAALIFMAMGVFGGLIFNWAGGNLTLMELTPASLINFQPDAATNTIFPFLFIVVSCGAISGFHATQSPLMARCLKSERQGRHIFYGAMIAEGIVAMIWATAAMNYMGDVHGLNYAFTHPLADNPSVKPDPAWLVNEICRSWLGKAGAIIAVVGVVACPVTSGDTAFRSARLTIADMLGLQQKKISSRLLIVVPVFTLAFILTFVMKDEFARIWKFVGISNQALAAITCWTIAMYLGLRGKTHLIMSLPALFITAVCVTYLLSAPHSGGGLALPMKTSVLIGLTAAAAAFVLFLAVLKKKKTEGGQ
ncbi:MAG: carbon starvation protein A [Bacteroidales bacterium]|jgi:carbon starvation protein CstA|nr:carbon starvation protein A [Bacteroidales bacterium]